jgi:hypothetical protein
MAPDLFEQELRRFIRARPFYNFVIEMNDGRTIVVDQPTAAINSGGAGLVDADGEIQFIEGDQVRELRLTREELAK